MTCASDVLRDEHTVILRALELLESASDRLDRGESLPAGWWDGLLDWLRGFTDGRHHAKEERSLFPAMVEAGISDGPGGLIGTMLEEHALGRELIATMATGAGAARAGAARAYVALLRAHIDKENAVLFPLADAVLEEARQRRLQHEFAAFDAAPGEAGLQRLASELG